MVTVEAEGVKSLILPECCDIDAAVMYFDQVSCLMRTFYSTITL